MKINLKQKHKLKTFVKRFYRGHSMRGTFRQGDLLVVGPARVDALRPGDVVVFIRGTGTKRQEIVHRVIRRAADGLVTRGDAAAGEDSGLVNESNLVGRVLCRIRNSHVGSVQNGWQGLIRGGCLHCLFGIRRCLSRMARNPYRMLREAGIVGRFWRPRIIRVKFESTDGPCFHYICNKHVVARHWPEHDRYECGKPWDLVVRRMSRTDRWFAQDK